MKTKCILNIFHIIKTIIMHPDAIFFRVETIRKIKENLITPPTGYVVINPDNMRFSCYIDGDLDFITLASKKEAATFLVENGIIDFFTEEDGQIILKRYTYSMHPDVNGVPQYCMQTKVVEWDKLPLTSGDVKDFFARKEYKRCMLGEPRKGKAKIIRMGTHRTDITNNAA